MWIAMCERVDNLGTTLESNCFCGQALDNLVPRIADKDIEYLV